MAFDALSVYRTLGVVNSAFDNPRGDPGKCHHDEKREFFQIEVFAAQIERFAHARPAAVKQAGDQVGGLAGPVPHGLEQGLEFGDGGGVAQARRAPGAEGINVLQGLAEDLVADVRSFGEQGFVLAAEGDGSRSWGVAKGREVHPEGWRQRFSPGTPAVYGILFTVRPPQDQRFSPTAAGPPWRGRGASSPFHPCQPAP